MAKKIPFTKMHGIGNDYVYINGFREHISNPGELAKRMSDRHFGIGSDGLIIIEPSHTADLRMRMFNADGTEAEMCGNASRCVGKYAADHGLVRNDMIRLETGAGIKILRLEREDGEVIGATVDMGEPILAPSLIPVAETFCTTTPVQEVPLSVDGTSYSVTCVSMGNPHAVLFLDEIETLDLPAFGPRFENNPAFPKRTNTEFIRVLSREAIAMRVWERGAGETLACGTGACAAVVASVLTNRTDRDVTVHLRGGDLKISWNVKDNHVFMTGNAVTVFDGEFYC